MHLGDPARFSQKAQEVLQEVFAPGKRHAGLGLAVFAVTQGYRLHRCLGFEGGLEDARMKGANGLATAGTTFGKHAHGLAGLQARHHLAQDTIERIIVATLVIDGAGTAGQPTHQRPPANFGFGDKADHALAVYQLDVDPGHVVGHQQERPGHRFAKPAQAKAENAHQGAGPGPDGAVIDPLAGHDPARRQGIDQKQGQRQAQDQMHQQQGNAPDITHRTQRVAEL